MRSRTALGLVALALTAAACGGTTDNGELRGGGPDEAKDTSSAGNELVVLQDDLHLQTVDNVVPVVATKVMSPVVEQALNKVVEGLTTADLVALNRQADLERKTPANVAKAYFDQEKIGADLPTGGSGKLVIGAANFNENKILANLFKLALDQAGFQASVKPVTNREVYEPALERGEISVVPEYVGTLTEFLNKKANGPDATALASSDVEKTVTALRGLAEKKGLTVLEPAEAADQNAFAVTKTFATENKLSKLSDLKAYKGKLVLGGPAECPTRRFCQPGLEKTYGLTFDSFVSLDAGGPLTKTALKTGKIQLGLVFSSDASLAQL
jgi:osmoprotectant transport system substrate-binding protein